MSTPTFAKTHNLIAYLAKPTESEGFEQIIDFLNESSVSYALTAIPTIRTSCIKQFWITTKVNTINDEVRIQALIDEKKVNIKEYSIRRTLKLDDAEATGEVGLFQDNVHSTTIPTKPSTSKPHKKHKSKKQPPQAPKVPSPELSLQHMLPSPSNDPLLGGEDSLKLKKLMDLCTHLSKKVLELESEEENINLKDLYNVHSKVDIATPVVEKEKSFKHERIIAEIDEDDVNDEEPAKVEEVLKVVKAAKLMTEVVTTAGTTTTAEATKVSVPKRRRSVVIQDPEETI
nr:hypothetical protein [Tanacetum cinerariifolium]